jgi:hypothetical protein
MSLRDWAKDGWLRPHRTTPDQIAAQLALVDRDLKDAGRELSADWQFNIAYNAALQLCSILLNAEGWRPERNLAHYRTLQSLPLILGNDWQNDADYLDTCRSKRNKIEYDAIGQVTGAEAKELADFAKKLREEVLAWLKEKHPELENR